ncbi:MAG: flavin reductase family protein, partial [Candidatus Omnitrophota bacterium]
CKERRTIHANGDGTFVVNGRTLNLKKRMVKWKSFI